MIYTNYGNICEIIGKIDANGNVPVSIDYRDGGPLAGKTVHVSELKADDGMSEIIQAANNSLPACLERGEVRQRLT